MEPHVCSVCGQAANFDGRCGDGPYLSCPCVDQTRGIYVPDRCGGYTYYPGNPHPVPAREYAKR